MNIKIVLTSYLLTYMYGDLVFHNSLLLTREVIKKAYTEGLFYISSEKNIDEILKQKDKKRTLLTFSGIPSFEEVCMNLSPSRNIYALKIKLPYEELASFTYQETKEILTKKQVSLEEAVMTKIKLNLNYIDKELCYNENECNEDELELAKDEILKHFKKEIENYRYAIENRMNYLRKLLFEFLETEKSKAFLEDTEKLQELKESYEELMS